MRHTIKNLMIGATLLLGAAACANLDVVNPNDADAARALSTPGDVESLIAGAFNTWYGGDYAWYGPGTVLSNQSFQHNAPWANAGMEYYGRIPRNPINQGDADYRDITRVWTYAYRAIAAVSDGLRSIENDPTVSDALGASNVIRDKAYGYFVLGMAHGSLALLYDRGFVIDDQTDITQPQDPVPYGDMAAAAVGYLDKAIQLCSQGSFTIPTSWMATENLDNTLLAKIAHSEEARIMAAVARSPAERQAVNWAKVIQEIDAGITDSWLMEVYDDLGWYNGPMDAGASEGWSQMAYWVYGMADQAGNYQRWLDQPISNKTPAPSDGNIIIVTPDLRFPQGTTLTEQNDNPGTYFDAPTWLSGEVWAHPERGTWRWSWYRNYRYESYVNTYNEVEPEIPVVAMKLLKAEALYWTGKKAEAAAIINETRVAAGLSATDETGINTSCVPKLPDGTCGGLLEMIKWERRMEIQFTGLMGAPWWFDSRGWGDLWKNTPLEFPIPCSEVQTLQIPPCYGFGGAGGEMSAPTSTYNYPGEAG